MQWALRKNPNDMETLLHLAAMAGTLKEPDLHQKRRLLHRILSLEPGNPRAQKMLFEMDRAEIGGNVSRLSAAVILTDPSSSVLPESPLILRYSIVGQLLVYLFIACIVFASLKITRNGEVLALVGALLMIPLWFVSVVIEIRDDGLNVSRLFGVVRSEIRWRDIEECKPTIIRRGLRIISRKGKAVEVSAQIHGYTFILDILRQMRPDIFSSNAVSRSGGALQSDAAARPTVAKTAGKT